MSQNFDQKSVKILIKTFQPFSHAEVSALDSGFYYKGYPEMDYFTELSFPITLPSSEKWGLIYAGLRIGKFVVIGEIYKWAHISPQVWKWYMFGTPR